MGNKLTRTKLSRDQEKLHSFYSPNISEQKMQLLETKAKKLRYKYFYKAFIFGFILEYFLGVGRIYDKANRNSTVRRLNAKRKENEKLANESIKKQDDTVEIKNV